MQVPDMRMVWLRPLVGAFCFLAFISYAAVGFGDDTERVLVTGGGNGSFSNAWFDVNDGGTVSFELGAATNSISSGDILLGKSVSFINSNSGPVTIDLTDHYLNHGYTLFETSGTLNFSSNLTFTSSGTNNIVVVDGVGGLTFGTSSADFFATAVGTATAIALDTDGIFSAQVLGGSISATAASNTATGIYAGAGLTIGMMSGGISATTAGTGSAYGIDSEGASSITLLTGSISAVTTGSTGTSYAFYSNGPVIIGTSTGTISANSTLYEAYGIFSPSDITITGTLGGVVATTGTDSYGVDAHNLSIGTSTANIVINVVDNAGTSGQGVGLFASHDVTIQQLGGTISATYSPTTTFGSALYGVLVLQR